MFFREEQLEVFYDVKNYNRFGVKHRWFCLYVLWNKKKQILLSHCLKEVMICTCWLILPKASMCLAVCKSNPVFI